MPIQYDNKISEFRKIDPRPRVVVESGTYRGEMTIRLSNIFDRVHTIEMSDELYADRPEDLAGSHVTWHHGDTRVVLPKLCLEIEEPVLWFLDAHYFAGKGAARGGLPLWNELSAIVNRPYADVIAVDDVHTFGKTRPLEFGNWAKVTKKSIASALTRVEVTWTAADMYLIRRKACS